MVEHLKDDAQYRSWMETRKRAVSNLKERGMQAHLSAADMPNTVLDIKENTSCMHLTHPMCDA